MTNAQQEAIENHKNSLAIMNDTLEGLKRHQAMLTKPPINERERDALRIPQGNINKAIIYKQREIDAEIKYFNNQWICEA